MGISIWQLLIVLGIIILLFGTKKLRNIGADLGGAVKGFKSAMKDGEKSEPEKTENLENQQGRVIDVEAVKEKNQQS